VIGCGINTTEGEITKNKTDNCRKLKNKIGLEVNLNHFPS